MSTPNPTRTIDVTIGAGASLSASSGLLSGGERLIAVATDAAWDTASITFQGSLNGTDYYDMRDESGEYTLSGVTASDLVAVTPTVFLAPRYIKARSGTAGAAVNQVDATVVKLVVRPW